MSTPHPMSAHPRRYVSNYVPHNSNAVTMILMGMVTATSITMGYDASVMNGLNILPSYTDYFDPNTTSLSLNTASFWVGSMVAAFFAGQMSDWLGRKPLLFCGALVTIIGISSVAAPTYMAEIASIQWRATLLALYFDLWFMGGLIAAGITYGTKDILTTWAWRLPSLLQVIPSIFCIFVLPFIPESPRWLAYKDRPEDALEVLAVAHGWGDQNDPVVVTEYQEIIQTLGFEKQTGSVSPLETVRTPGNRYRIILAVTVAIFSMTQGNNVVTYYLGSVLSQAGVTDTNIQLQVNMILNAWSFILTLCGTFLADSLGRKWLALISTALCTVFIFLTGVFSHLYGDGSNQSGSYATIAMIFLFMGSYSFGWTPLTVMYPVEVLNYSTRAVGMGIYSFWANGIGLMITFAFPFSFEAIGYKTYMINGAFNAFSLVLIAWTWVETKGRSLEEIDVLFDGVRHADVLEVGEVIRMRGKVDVETIVGVAVVAQTVREEGGEKKV